MGEKTKIAWTDHTFNPWKICTPIGPGCENCYAAALSRRWGWGEYAQGVPRQRTSASNWKQPLAWDRKAKQDGLPHRVFCASLADVFDNEVDVAWRYDLWDLIAWTPNLSWLLTTKRVGNVNLMVPEAWRRDGFPPNVRVIATIVNQEEADRDIPKLLALPCKNGISYEPALGPVDWAPFLGGCGAIETQRGRGVSGSCEWRIDHRQPGPDLAGGIPPLESENAELSHDSMCASESGERHREISTNSRDVQRKENTGFGASVGMEALQRTNTGPANRQPQGREEEAERAGQPGAGDTFGTNAALSSRFENCSMREPGRNEERDGEINTRESNGNPEASIARREPVVDSGRLRDQVSNRIENSPRRPVGRIGWLICGGESKQAGHVARPFNMAWGWQTIQQCRDAGVPCFMKQIGSSPHDADGFLITGYKDRAGADPAEWPEDLRVREFPK